MGSWKNTNGLHDLGNTVYAYLQSDHDPLWAWSNAGIIVDGDAALLVDTLNDVKHAQEMLTIMQRSVPAA